MIVSLAACTPTAEKNKTGEVKQTQAAANGVSDKLPDPTAPDLDVISIYSVSSDGTKLVMTMDAVEEKTPQVLVDLLIENGILKEGTKALDFETKGKPEEEVGPGVVKIPGLVIEVEQWEQGILNLSQAPEDDLELQAVANTFLENMNVLNLTIQVNGEVAGEGFTYVDPGK